MRNGNYNANISKEGIKFLTNLSGGGACTEGASKYRNEWKEKDITPVQYAVDLRQGNQLNYKIDQKTLLAASLENRPNQLAAQLQPGDVLIYTNPANPNGDQDKGWTGHTATVIKVEPDYVTTLDFHEKGADPTIGKLSVDNLSYFSDTTLYGGASWK